MKKQVIICVDDEPTVLESLEIELHQALGDDYLIETASDGEEALELLTELLAEEYEVALIIVDYIMPNMKGDELLIQMHGRSPKSITIMLTGQAEMEGVWNAIQYAKLYRYISKPWERSDMSLTVKEAVNSYRQDKEVVETNEKLRRMNQNLEKLTREQARLIESLKEAEAQRVQHTKEILALNQAFSRFVPSQFIHLLQKESIVDVELGDNVQQKMSVLFSDIRDFTTLSESMTPEDNFKFINAYLLQMEPAIIENHGFIDKYIGDEIMALFSGEADNAVKAGIAMLHSLTEYNNKRKRKSRPLIRIGIGINTGDLMLGTIGGVSRMDSTVISDAVNLASRMESLTKNYGVPLLIAHQTFSRLTNPEQYAIRKIDEVRVKGKSELAILYEVFDADAPEVRSGKLATLELFAEALSLYNQYNVSEAKSLFSDCVKQNPGDKVAQFHLQRCCQ